ncbi:MotA/TolQ/ExbB proton channel family protein [Phaeobacter sp. B1627]|uniref:MotA/TolQ/ExbB proton channel family protein n=1 Tax=Phaeobacter sp. B1627 TaxID=2583809 RepID=UPI00111A5923|nr:MotA/TolQ/ExbB proton channel family protein [Phaeobacter sp. B1627]TNJ47481.1 MotA/TolQ/ExbB proton channel family protein [Phaeobacter sp. B1627]
MKTPLLLTTFLLLPVLAQAQTTAPDSGLSPVPSLATELVAPTAPEQPQVPDTPLETDLEVTVPATAATTAEETAVSPAPSASVPDVTAAAEPVAVEITPENMQDRALDALETAKTFLRNGGPSIWAIAALSVITLALILWKIWRLALIGAWSRGKARKAVAAYEAGDADRAVALVAGRRGVRSKVVYAALSALRSLPDHHAREETARVAKRELGSARSGLGALELISTIAPLLGLLGTVLGMIAAFQALQTAGSKADPSMLAGGIWEALLTTAAGMAVAIPASAALTWFEAVIDRIRRDVEDSATRLFVSEAPQNIRLAAE